MGSSGGSLSSTTLGEYRPFSSYERPFLIIEDKCERKTQNCAWISYASSPLYLDDKKHKRQLEGGRVYFDSIIVGGV